MDDVSLFWELSGDAGPSHDVAGALEQIGALEPQQRLPFLAFAEQHASKGDAHTRTLSLRCLVGCASASAARIAVKALSQPGPERTAALDVLLRMAKDRPARWAHALFHQDAAVRGEALVREQPEQTGGWAIYLLADPDNRATARRLLGLDQASTRSSFAIAGPTVIEGFVNGHLEGAEARLLLASADQRSFKWALRLKARPLETCRALLAEAASGEASAGHIARAAGGDELERFFELFWPGDDAEQQKQVRTTLTQICSSIGDDDERARLSCALLVEAARRGQTPPMVAGALTELHPPSLRFRWLGESAASDGLSWLLWRGEQVHKVDDEIVEPLIKSDLCKREGALDLRAVTAVARLMGAAPFERLFDWLGFDAVVEALLADVERNAVFLSLPDSSPKGRDRLFEHLATSVPATHHLILAYTSLLSPVKGLDHLDRLSSSAALSVGLGLISLMRDSGAKASSKRTEHVGKALGSKLTTAQLPALVEGWLREGEDPISLGAYMLGTLAGQVETDDLVGACVALPIDRLARLLSAVPYCPAFPYGKEMALAAALQGHGHDAVRGWAEARLPPPAAPRAPAPAGSVALGEAERRLVATASDEDLPGVVLSLGVGRRGLAEALIDRGAFASGPVCAALVAGLDPLTEVDDALVRWAAATPSFSASIEEGLCSLHAREPTVSRLAQAFLYRWDRHAERFIDALIASGEPADELGEMLSCRSMHASSAAADALLNAAMVLAYRDADRLPRFFTERTAGLLVSLLEPRPDEAAKALALLFASGRCRATLEPHAPRAKLLEPDLPLSARQRLTAWLASSAAAVGAVHEKKADRAGPSTVRDLDLDQLEGLVRSGSRDVVEEAALELVSRGSAGELRAARLLAEGITRERFRGLCECVPYLTQRAAIDEAISFCEAAETPADRRFWLLASLVEGGHHALEPALLDAACADSKPPFFRSEDFSRLASLCGGEQPVARRLAASPQPAAYLRAVDVLVAGDSPENREALRAFLRTGPGRDTDTRVRVAGHLHAQGDGFGLPLLFVDTFASGRSRPWLLSRQPRPVVEQLFRSAMLAGTHETALLACVTSGLVDREIAEPLLARLLIDAESEKVKATALNALPTRPSRDAKLRAVAETLAWGVRRGRELTGTLFNVEMLAGSALGYTRLNEARIHVNVLPLLRRDRHGGAIVEGLILHELGHHLYHKGEGASDSWKTADREGLGRLLNLVADEHLERNLRGVDPAFGDRLKRLAAYGFQHSSREMNPSSLLEALRMNAFAVLTQARLGVARSSDSVRVESGALLRAMERAGMSFAKFVRALRMGLGNRHDDPKVEAGLALFRGNFKQSTMPELLEITRKLRDIFGGECESMLAVGTSEDIGADPCDQLVEGEGLTPEEVAGEVERVLNPRARPEARAGATTGKRRLWINVAEDEQFSLISTVERVAHDPYSHAPYVREVGRFATHMRRYLTDLGLTRQNQRMRLSGYRFDRSRAQALVLRGDPRVLLARELVTNTDLFLGVAVDCSGSMAGASIEKAKHFAVLLAQAVRGLAGVDFAVFGFTDSVIYDAGDATHCGASALVAGGGNNDAAGLYHLATVAKASRRKAKVLVMISDGLPTECSVTALRALVRRLSQREGMCLAQVAVRPLEEVCFPHYVLLEEGSTQVAVRRFGQIVAGLVRKAMQG